VLDDVTLIDGTGAPPRPHSRIVIAGRRLMAVGARDAVQVPEGATRLPVAGSWVLPGLVDLHAHVTFLRDPARFRDYDRATSEQVLRIILAHGITLARNPAAPATEGVALRDDLRAGRLAGPRLLTAGEAIDFGPDRTEDEVRAEVRRQAALGVDFIKVYARMPPSHVGAAVEEAHRRGLKVIGHLQATTAAEAARLGIDAITHATTWTPSLLPLSRRAAYEESQRAKGFIRARIDWLEAVDVEGPEISDVVRAVAERHIPLDPTLMRTRPSSWATSRGGARARPCWPPPPPFARPGRAPSPTGRRRISPAPTAPGPSSSGSCSVITRRGWRSVRARMNRIPGSRPAPLCTTSSSCWCRRA
jgi:hypothetical protein